MTKLDEVTVAESILDTDYVLGVVDVDGSGAVRRIETGAISDLLAESVIQSSLTIAQEMVEDVTEKVDAIESFNVHQPYISEDSDRHWMLWNGTEYVDSGFSAKGDVYGMDAEVYDPQGKETDIFAYIDEAVEGFDATDKVDKENPEATGYFSLNRKSGVTIGENSFAEGDDSAATGAASHAEGDETFATGAASHSEGHQSVAEGDYAHAEGDNTDAKGDGSHAEGIGTIAHGDGQHVEGTFNIEDTNDDYIHIVGNGTESQRSNAHTLKPNGDAWYAGDVYVGENSEKLAKDSDVAKSVNGQTPDSSGNVAVNVGVKTVNGLTPDQNGNIAETDPTVPSWAKQQTKPTYTKSEVGLGNVQNASINRSTNVNAADTGYTTLMARGEKLLDATTFDGVTDWSGQLVNGAIAWRYE